MLLLPFRFVAFAFRDVWRGVKALLSDSRIVILLCIVFAWAWISMIALSAIKGFGSPHNNPYWLAALGVFLTPVAALALLLVLYILIMAFHGACWWCARIWAQAKGVDTVGDGGDDAASSDLEECKHEPAPNPMPAKSVPVVYEV